MSILSILHFPDERLRIHAAPVTQIDGAIQQIVDDMIETVHTYDNCVALAATQVDIHQRIIVIDLSETQDQPLVLINPEMVSCQGEAGIDEGCMSVPENYGFVLRSETISVKSLDRHGNEFILDAEGFLAICIQHEMDHLEGKLFVDYLSSLKRQRIRQKLEKLARMEARSK